MSSIKRTEIHTAGFLDDLSSIQNHRNVDTSRSRAGQVIRELKMARRDARILAEQARGKVDPKGSPYVEDRQRIHEFKGTNKETEWKVVRTREQEVRGAHQKEVLEARERDLHAARQELNKKKLNII